jgi:cell division protein FtsB
MERLQNRIVKNKGKLFVNKKNKPYKQLIFIALIVGLLAIIFLPGYSELQKTREDNEQQKRRILFLEEDNDRLKTELKKLKDNPDLIEEKARKKLGIVKQDEIIYKKKK